MDIGVSGSGAPISDTYFTILSILVAFCFLGFRFVWSFGDNSFRGKRTVGRHLGKYSGSIHSHLDGRWGELELVLLSSQLSQSAAAASLSASSSSPSPAISRSLGHFCSNRLLCFTIHSSTSHTRPRGKPWPCLHYTLLISEIHTQQKRLSRSRGPPFLYYYSVPLII